MQRPRGKLESINHGELPESPELPKLSRRICNCPISRALHHEPFELSNEELNSKFFKLWQFWQFWQSQYSPCFSKIFLGFSTSMVSNCSSVTPCCLRAGITSLWMWR